jgi:streptogramin lyase
MHAPGGITRAPPLPGRDLLHVGRYGCRLMKRASRLLLPLLTAAVLLLSAGTAQAVPTFGGTSEVSEKPGEIARGPDNNLWVVLENNKLARITPNGTVTEFTPAALNNPVGIASGPDGNLWLTQPNEVVKVPPSDPDAAEDFPVAAITDPRGITSGPEGALWAASGDKLVKIPPANPAGFTDFTITNMNARGITAADGFLWIADFGEQRIVRSDPAGDATFFPTGAGNNPQEVAGGPGGQVAFSNPADALGRISPVGGLTQVAVPGADAFGVALGRDQNWYFAQFADDGIGRLTPQGAYTNLDLLSAGSGPRYLAAGPNGTLWVSLVNTNEVARITGIDPPSPPPSAAKAQIDKAPKKKVKTKRRKAKVKFRFSSSTTGAKFECALRRKGKRNKVEKRLAKFRSCASPKAYKVRKGRYTFLVRVAGSSAKPAKHSFRVIRKKRR